MASGHRRGSSSAGMGAVYVARPRSCAGARPAQHPLAESDRPFPRPSPGCPWVCALIPRPVQSRLHPRQPREGTGGVCECDGGMGGFKPPENPHRHPQRRPQTCAPRLLLPMPPPPPRGACPPPPPPPPFSKWRGPLPGGGGGGGGGPAPPPPPRRAPPPPPPPPYSTGGGALPRGGGGGSAVVRPPSTHSMHFAIGAAPAVGRGPRIVPRVAVCSERLLAAAGAPSPLPYALAGSVFTGLLIEDASPSAAASGAALAISASPSPPAAASASGVLQHGQQPQQPTGGSTRVRGRCARW